jgi:hypothetical protein
MNVYIFVIIMCMQERIPRRKRTRGIEVKLIGIKELSENYCLLHF